MNHQLQQKIDYNIYRIIWRELNTLHNVTLYVWVGTCNLTKREGDFIYHRSRDNSAVNKLISDLKNIYHFVKQFGNQVKLVFSQLPVYSIHEFNAYQGYQEENSFEEDDYILKEQIDAVNFYIHDTNRFLHAISPKFSEDLQKPRRRKTSTTISYNINYSLLQAFRFKAFRDCVNFTFHLNSTKNVSLFERYYVAHNIRGLIIKNKKH